MNLPTSHIEQITVLGYTESEARFLYIVATHSGYFTMRQFLAFAGARRGKRTTTFTLKLLKHAHATVRDYMGTGSIFHLFSRTIYKPIEKDNFRNRRRHSFDYIRTRLVLLDFILENPEYDFLETEQEKVHFFCDSLCVPKEALPAKVYEGLPGSHPTIRFFVDKFPLFLAPPFPGLPPVVTFTYVDHGCASLTNFTSHLGAYQSLFRHLQSFRFLYIAPRLTQFGHAEASFRNAIKRPIEADVSSEIFRYFEIRRKWESHKYIVPVTEDFEFLAEARRRFRGERFEELYRDWYARRLDERQLRIEFSQPIPDRTVFFDTYLVGNEHTPLDDRLISRVNMHEN
ncbi:MAG: hypothetical protein LAN61_04815 [Acidobacteriia bacterium]|nr:hypothetical protein [Terriglobia bacterium]